MALSHQSSRSCSWPVLIWHPSIGGRSRIWSTQREETDSVRSLSIVSCALTRTWSSSGVWSSMRLVCCRGTFRWRLKSLCQTTRTGSLTVSLTPSLNPTRTLTKFLRHVTRRMCVFFYFNILSSTLFLYFIFNFFCIFVLQNQCRQITHVLH